MSSHVSRVTFKFDNFESLPSNPDEFSLPSNPDEFTSSEEVADADNNKWVLSLLPGGLRKGPPTEGDQERHLVIALSHSGTNDLDVVFSFIIRNKKGEIFSEVVIASLIEGGNKKSWYFSSKLSELLDETNDILLDGALHVECLIQFKHKVDFEGAGHFYLPPNPVAIDVVDLLTSSDALFSIGKKEFRLHQHVLRERAPILANMCEGGTKDKFVPLTNVTSEVFSIIIRYIYGGGPPDIEADDELLIEIIHAADFYEMEDLKMVVETILVAGRCIELYDVVDWLLLADAKTCPLLKEYAMVYITARPGDVLKSESYALLSPELNAEIIIFMHQKYNPSGDGSIRSLTVDELRRKLSEKGLDVYGSKDALMSRLEEFKKRKRDEE